ncbi:hypothetical protein ABTY20_03820 [Streptomyces sp. NPDC126497]|uniref:hypothetical protein n=1 Tax=Streptomyces sp. NPDC126497 TaxID=3155313 RepID=UPI00331934E8
MEEITVPGEDDEDEQRTYTKLLTAIGDYRRRHHHAGPDILGPRPAGLDGEEWDHLTAAIDLYTHARVQRRLEQLRARTAAACATLLPPTSPLHPRPPNDAPGPADAPQDADLTSSAGVRTVSRLVTVPWSPFAPPAQFVRRPCPDEGVHEDPRAIDRQDEVAAEGSRIVHHRDVDHGIRRDAAVPDEQERPLCIVEQMDDRPVTSKAKSQPGELTTGRPDLKVPLTAGAQFGEVLRQLPEDRIPLHDAVPSRRLQCRRRSRHAHPRSSTPGPPLLHRPSE